MHQSCDIKDTLFMIRYCTCYIEYLFRIDVTDSRDSESLSSALLPVSLLDAQIYLYTLVNISDINSPPQGKGEKRVRTNVWELQLSLRKYQAREEFALISFPEMEEYIHLQQFVSLSNVFILLDTK